MSSRNVVLGLLVFTLLPWVIAPSSRFAVAAQAVRIAADEARLSAVVDRPCWAGGGAEGVGSIESASEKSAVLDQAPEGSFTIAVLPDTHAGPSERKTKHNQYFDNHTRWIADNIETQRIVFVSHVGDIVNSRPGYGSCDNLEPWHIARRFMDRLHGMVPYAISVGNHDMLGGNSSRFQEFFPAQRFTDFDWYGGFYPGDPGRPVHESGNNANSYQRFSAEGYDFVFLHLECNAPDNVLQWADSVLRKHAERLALITTHMDLGPRERPEATVDEDGQHRSASWHFRHAPKGRMRWSKTHGSRGNSPQNMWDKLYSQHPNLRIIFSGDQSRTENRYQVDTGRFGNTVHAFLSDYRGSFRLYRFIPAAQKLRVITFDTTSEQLLLESQLSPEVEHHQFTVPFHFTLTP